MDQLILNLQMFDDDFVVPNMDKLNRNQRINKKLKLIRKSFKNLNIDLAPYGIMAGSPLGPKGAAAGAFLGTYVLLVVWQLLPTGNTHQHQTRFMW